ncbi:hypothetical protein [Umezawaea sp. Da 62-37]|uniref:hypothetical protein n=1 Tax=Umezawaea sp. Da 62-37 TaxID=3075927 RepID=UPI0028F71165|nr:hypothetical protein [Umezawaea sp. Da 62-37]WNV86652.1 hypothetical protein RM788_52495 [Umezawaea sp. Da 62-37]WNV86765.1 hypothetical protein RM788_00310 [Umezawaea sp. Da 62-37]
MTVPPHVALRRVARAHVGADLYCPDVTRLEVRAAAPDQIRRRNVHTLNLTELVAKS